MQNGEAWPMEITLKNVKLALLKIHVCGAEAGLLDGAIRGVDQAISAIEKAKAWECEQKEKEVAADADHDEQRKDI